MLEGPLVAIVDDDKSIRNATQDLLKAAGFSTATFEDAESFLGSASRASTACVVADMRMPGMTGVKLYQELVASGHAIPTVIITAHPEELDASACARSGNHLLSHQAVHTGRASRVRTAKRSRSRRRPALYQSLKRLPGAPVAECHCAIRVYLVTMARRSACA